MKSPDDEGSPLRQRVRLRLKPLSEQVVVITGASSGIGRATALAAARRGARVVLAARGADALASLTDEIAAASGRALAVPCDVASASGVEALAARAAAWGGGIDTWVNNAGVAIACRLDELAEDDARQLFETNFWGTVHGCRAALPYLARRGGALVNLGSFVSDVAAPYMGIYSASKHAVRGYTDALRIEQRIAGRPVSVTLVKPAPVATPVLQHQRNRLGAQATMPPPFYRPEDAAAAILHAAEHPVRDLYVGGVARAGSLLGPLLPGVTDYLAFRLGPRLFMNDEPAADRPDNLSAASTPAAVAGNTHGHVGRRSLYTALRVRPRLAIGLALGVAASAAILARRRGVSAHDANRTAPSDDRQTPE